MQKKIDLKSMLLGSTLAAAVMLSVAAATTNQEPDRSILTTGENRMERVTGIGGVFFKARDPKKMAAWYRDHPAIQSKGGYTDFLWRDKDNPDTIGHTAWALFPTNTTYFGSYGGTYDDQLPGSQFGTDAGTASSRRISGREGSGPGLWPLHVDYRSRRQPD